MTIEPHRPAGSANVPPSATLDSFCDRVRAANPFLTNRVDRPLDADLADVPGIHQAAFDRILALGGQAHEENRGVGVVVWGEAGVGKSHLLARLGRWAAQGQACSVYLHNLQASPERLPRYVLKAVVSSLTAGLRPPLKDCPLFRLLNGALTAAMNAVGLPRGTWDQIAAAHARLVADLAAADPSGGVLFDRTAHQVLFRFFRGAHPQHGDGEDIAALAARWLSGDALEPAEARRLGLPAQPGAGPVALADNQHVKQVLVALTQLARAAGRLFLLLFDQVDNLDESQVKALSRFLHDLLDSAGDLLIVTTGVRQTLLGFLQRGVITETSWDRLGQFDLALGRLRQPQGRELLEERLRRFLEPFRGVKEVRDRLRDDPLFPLGSAWFEARVRDLADFRPRDLIGWACTRWQQQQELLVTVPGKAWLQRWPEGGEVSVSPPPPPEDPVAAVDRKVEEKLAERRTRCRQDPAVLPPSEDHLLDLVASLLQTCLTGERPYRLEQCQRLPLPKTGTRRPYDLLLEQRVAGDGRTARLGVRFLVTSHGNGVASALRWLLEDPAPPGRVLLVTDARQPPPQGPEGRRRFDELQRRDPERFRHLEVTRDQYIELDALQEVVRLAKAGDLEVELPSGQRRAVTEEEVVASHHRRGRYLAQPLLAELLGGSRGDRPAAPARPAPESAPPLNESGVRQFIMAQVALHGPVSLDELSRGYALQQGRAPDPSAWWAQLREIATRMAGDGLIRTVHGENGPVLAPAAHPAAP